MIALGAPVVALCLIVGLAIVTWRLAAQWDRIPAAWTALSLAATAVTVYFTWKWLLGAESEIGLLAAGLATWIGPPVASGAVIALLHWIGPGRPRIGRSVAVRLMDGGHELGQLELGEEELTLITRAAERRIARVDLERVQADGECLRLALRSGGELRLLMVGPDDPRRRRRLCDALAQSLIQPPTPAQLRP